MPIPTPPSSEDDLLAAYYHDRYPGLKKEFFAFLHEVPQMCKELFGPTRIITDHWSSLDSKTVAYSKYDLFTHLCQHGYITELATFLTQHADEGMIPRMTLMDWTTTFLSYASLRSWADVARGHTQVPSSESTNQTLQYHPTFPSATRSIHYGSTTDDALKTLLASHAQENPNYKLLLHFTSKESSVSILDGIDLLAGNGRSEFAVRGAFYLADSVNFGLRWLRTKFPQDCVVLVFEVPTSFFEQHRCFEVVDDDWKRFCYYNFNSTRNLRSTIEIDNDVIYGPICKFRATPPAHVDHSTLEAFQGADGNVCYQYAIIKHPVADAFMAYLTQILDVDVGALD
ncbi:hypothetical protein HDV05_008555 [Chytridiales sp. JEL 0842]|nr:hypothetical protein HDV05_008555 [Chytridiales sp. JEL 0842]